MNAMFRLKIARSGSRPRVLQHLIALSLFSFACTLSAQHSIGLKLGQSTNPDQQGTAAGALQPGDLAGAPGYAQTNWNVLGRNGNNSTNAFGTNSYAIIDSGGDDTHITLTWDSPNSWSVANGATPVDQGDPLRNLMNPYIDSNGNGNVALTNGLTNGIFGQNNNNKPLIYVFGLQAWLATESASQYDVVLYMDGDNQAGRAGEYWVANASGPVTNITFGADLTTHVFIRDFNNFPVNPTFQGVPFTSNNGRVAGSGNFTVFTGLSADSILIRSSEFNTRCGINAIQIIPRTTPVGATIDPLLSASTYTGGNASFRANVAGVQPFAFQWQKNGLNLSDGGNIVGSTNATLTITNVSGGDAGNYSLVVSNAGGFSTSTVAPLTVSSPVAGSYPEKVFTNGAVAYWRFNETGDPSTNNSPAYDPIGGFNLAYGPLSQNGFSGIPGPQPTDFPGFEPGNSALRTTFSTATPLLYPSSYVSWPVGPALNLATNTVTLCAWIYPIGNQVNASAIIFERGADVSGFGYGANNNLGYTWNNAGNTFGFVSGLVPASNQWSFVALTIGPTNAILYLYNTNGQFSATNNVTHAVGNWAGPVMIGDDPSSTGTPQNRAFNGYIDEVAVFKRVLSDQELYLFYKKGLNVGIIPASISVNPASQSLFAGRTARFNVVGAGDRPLNYVWRSNGVPVVNGGRLLGAATPTLTISNLVVSDSAAYDVVVDNVAHSPVASAPATLTVIASNATPVAYEGVLQSLNPTHYWRLNEAAGSLYAYDYWNGNIATNSNVTTGSVGPQPPDFTGLETTNAAFTYVPDLLTPDNSSWTDTQQSYLNNLAQFSIVGWLNLAGIQPARVGLFGQNDVAEFGFHGADVSGFSQLGLWTPSGAAYLAQTNLSAGQWYMAAGVADGNNINLYLLTTNGSGGAQILQSTAPAITTNYGSSAFNFKIGGGGILDATGNYFSGLIDEVATFNRALNVGELANLFGAGIGVSGLPPQITGQPGPATNTLYTGRTARYSVGVVGSVPLTYQWRKNGAPLSNGGNISGATSATLTISNIASASIGSYDVVVTNNYGSVTSSIASLGVLTPNPNGYESALIGLNPLAYYRLNETNDPSIGTAVAYDFWGGNAGFYGTASQNGFNGIPGPQDPAFFGFEPNNSAVAVQSRIANSYVTAPFGSLSTNTVTMTMWINPTGIAGTDFDQYAGLLVNRNSGVAGGFGYTGGQIGYTWNNNNANTYNFRSGFVPPTNQWSFVGVVVTPTNGTIYYGNPPNPLQSAVNTLAHTSDVFGNNWQIGNDNNDNLNSGSRGFLGSIDEVAVFTKSLTPAQVQQLYSVGINGAPVTLTIAPSGANLVLTWARGTLQQAADINGPYSDVSSATSPYTISPSVAQQFFRVRVR